MVILHLKHQNTLQNKILYVKRSLRGGMMSDDLFRSFLLSLAAILSKQSLKTGIEKLFSTSERRDSARTHLLFTMFLETLFNFFYIFFPTF